MRAATSVDERRQPAHLRVPDVIKSVAESRPTCLVALNAAHIRRRVRRPGSRLAVVADEVRDAGRGTQIKTTVETSIPIGFAECRRQRMSQLADRENDDALCVSKVPGQHRCWRWR